MTVGELIYLLKQEDPAAVVLKTDLDGDAYEIRAVNRAFVAGEIDVAGWLKWGLEEFPGAKAAIELT